MVSHVRRKPVKYLNGFKRSYIWRRLVRKYFLVSHFLWNKRLQGYFYSFPDFNFSPHYLRASVGASAGGWMHFIYMIDNFINTYVAHSESFCPIYFHLSNIPTPLLLAGLLQIWPPYSLFSLRWVKGHLTHLTVNRVQLSVTYTTVDVLLNIYLLVCMRLTLPARVFDLGQRSNKVKGQISRSKMRPKCVNSNIIQSGMLEKSVNFSA